MKPDPWSVPFDYLGSSPSTFTWVQMPNSNGRTVYSQPDRLAGSAALLEISHNEVGSKSNKRGRHLLKFSCYQLDENGDEMRDDLMVVYTLVCDVPLTAFANSAAGILDTARALSGCFRANGVNDAALAFIDSDFLDPFLAGEI